MIDINLFLNTHQSIYKPIKESRYLWRKSLDKNNRSLPHKELQKIFPDEEISVSIGLVNDTAIDFSILNQMIKLGEFQYEFLLALKKISKLALLDKKNDYNFSTFVRNLLFWTLKNEKDARLMEDLLLNDTIPIISARADVLSNLLLTELEVASGMWSLMHRLANRPSLLGYNILYKYYNTLSSKLFENKEVNIVFLVHEKLAGYWDQFVDNMEILSEIVRGKVFASGPSGLMTNSKGVWYKGNDGKKYKVDVIYSCGNIIRFFDEKMQDIIKSSIEGKVIIQPTVNPLINNSQLALSLLHHPLTSSWFKNNLSKSTYSGLLSSSVKYYPIINKVRFPINKNDSVDMMSIKEHLTKIKQRHYLTRTILTNDFTNLSGGVSICKMNHFNKVELYKMIEESLYLGRKLEEKDAYLNYGDLRLSSISKYYRSSFNGKIKIKKLVDGKLKTFDLDNPRMRYALFYIYNGRTFGLEGVYRYYSNFKDTGFKMGGKYRSAGAVYKKD